MEQDALDLAIEACRMRAELVEKMQEVGMEIEMPVEGMPENIKRIVPLRVSSTTEVRDIGIQDGRRQAISDAVSLVDGLLENGWEKYPRGVVEALRDGVRALGGE